MSEAIRVLEDGTIPKAKGTWGLTATNPIPIASSEDGMAYLGRLAAEGDSYTIGIEFFGCMDVAEIGCRIECYEIFDIATGRNLCDIHLLPDAEQTVWKAPKGFYLREALPEGD